MMALMKGVLISRVCVIQEGLVWKGAAVEPSD